MRRRSTFRLSEEDIEKRVCAGLPDAGQQRCHRLGASGARAPRTDRGGRRGRQSGPGGRPLRSSRASLGCPAIRSPSIRPRWKITPRTWSACSESWPASTACAESLPASPRSPSCPAFCARAGGRSRPRWSGAILPPPRIPTAFWTCCPEMRGRPPSAWRSTSARRPSSVYLGDLETGKLVDRASAYNSQIACGEDVISRIIYARQPKRRLELQERVVSTINTLIDDVLPTPEPDRRTTSRSPWSRATPP